MQKKFPFVYSFFPRTFLLPIDSSEFCQQFSHRHNKTFIVKPEASCQGKGIFLVQKLADVPQDQQLVVQRYIDKPRLIEGLKFDLRIYVLVSGVQPLRIYMYSEGKIAQKGEK